MSKIRLYGSTSGYVELAAPAIASDVTTVIPDEAIATESYADSAASAAAATKAPLYFTENVQTGNYTLALSDVAKVVAMNNNSPATVTIPANSSVAFPVGTVINVYEMTGEGVSIVGAAGVTLRNAGTIADPYVEVSLRKRDTDEWVLSGNVS